MARGRGRGRIQQQANHRANLAMQRRLKTAHTEANLEYNPAIRAARQEAKGSAKRERSISGWYNQLAGAYNNEAQTAATAASTAEQATNQRLAEAGQRGTAALDEQATQDRSLANLVGGPTDPEGIARAAKALQSSQMAAADLAAPLTAQRANTTTYLAGRGSTARLAAIQAHRDNQQARRKIKTDITGARREKGAATIANFEKLTKADREAAAERTALGLKARQYAVGNRQAQARINVSRQNAKTSARNAGTSERSQEATEAHYKHPSKDNGLSPSTRNTNKKERQNAAALVHHAVTQAGPPKTEAEAAELERLAIEAGGAPREVHRAVAILRRQAKRRQEALAAKKQTTDLAPSPFG